MDPHKADGVSPLVLDHSPANFTPFLKSAICQAPTLHWHNFFSTFQPVFKSCRYLLYLTKFPENLLVYVLKLVLKIALPMAVFTKPSVAMAVLQTLS